MIVACMTNVNTALNWGVETFQQIEQDPRNVISPRGMRTIESPEPVTTVYYRPTERVLFSPTRDANPFFHFFEGLWMLAGRNDVEFLSRLNSRMASFSDDGEVLHGAYGFRWREHFAFDQVDAVVRLLKEDPGSRRAVIAMWDPEVDAVGTKLSGGGPTGKDVPCNTHLYFKIRSGALNMTICNRSNDMLWGAYGANAVHMSMLQEYTADKLGVPVGLMRQMSDSLHVYLDDKGGELWTKLKAAGKPELDTDPYRRGMTSFPMAAGQEFWDRDLDMFMDLAMKKQEVQHRAFRTPFFARVVSPLWQGWVERSVQAVAFCAAPDWRRAATEWLNRRM